MTKRPDEFLVNRILGGDQEAYAELVHRHLKRVFAICLGIMGQVADAEDVSQEVFVKGYEQLRSLNDPSRFAAWIGQIARNRCRDNLRARNRIPEQPLSSVIENTATVSQNSFDDLKTALDRLPEEHRLPLLLYYFDSKNTTTLARELGMTQGGVCARLHRARRELRILLEEGEGGHE